MAEDDQEHELVGQDDEIPHDDAPDPEAMPEGIEAPLLTGTVNLKGIARLLGVSPRTVGRWDDEDLLPDPDFQCGGMRRWKAEKIMAWYAGGGTKAARGKRGKK